MDDFLLSQTNSLLSKFQSDEDLTKDLLVLSKTLTGSSKASSSKS